MVYTLKPKQNAMPAVEHWNGTENNPEEISIW